MKSNPGFLHALKCTMDRALLEAILTKKLSRCDLSPGLSSISIRSPPRRGCEGGSASRCAQASHPALELQIHTFPRACPPVRVFQSVSPATQPPDHRHLQDKDTVRTDFVLR